MEKPGSTLGALGVLAAVVAVHEAGHFFAAKSQDVKVTNFSIGFGPPLASYQVRKHQVLLSHAALQQDQSAACHQRGYHWPTAHEFSARVLSGTAPGKLHDVATGPNSC
jgi:hypothetical protein